MRDNAKRRSYDALASEDQTSVATRQTHQEIRARASTRNRLRYGTYGGIAIVMCLLLGWLLGWAEDSYISHILPTQTPTLQRSHCAVDQTPVGVHGTSQQSCYQTLSSFKPPSISQQEYQTRSSHGEEEQATGSSALPPGFYVIPNVFPESYMAFSQALEPKDDMKEDMKEGDQSSETETAIIPATITIRQSLGHRVWQRIKAFFNVIPLHHCLNRPSLDRRDEILYPFNGTEEQLAQQKRVAVEFYYLVGSVVCFGIIMFLLMQLAKFDGHMFARFRQAREDRRRVEEIEMLVRGMSGSTGSEASPALSDGSTVVPVAPPASAMSADPANRRLQGSAGSSSGVVDRDILEHIPIPEGSENSPYAIDVLQAQHRLERSLSNTQGAPVTVAEAV
ncbi:MAG: hypothetical protein Q9218_005507 [Villophora microphyllina]